MAKRKLTDADNKFVAEFLENGYMDKDIKTVFTRRNRFTGVEVELSPISAAAFDFIQKIEPILYDDEALKRIHPKLSSRNAVSKFDRARYIVMKLEPDAYIELLD